MLPNIIDLLDKRAKRGISPEFTVFYCINTETQEMARVDFDFKNKRFFVDRAVSGWKQFAIVHEDFVRVDRK